MKRYLLLALSLLFIAISCTTKQKQVQKKPKLIVGVVVDQMRYDYLIRFADKYGNNGFKRLLRDGYSLENTHYNYIPTYTAVGHTSIYTGTTPTNHGIISNNWYDKYLQKSVYCVDDTNYKTVGNEGKGGQKSPYRMQTTTMTDQLRLAQNMGGKTIGIAIKDRSAILPAGHTATAAYWFDGGSKGEWISSSFYMDTLPQWVKDFNKSGKADAYLSKPWETLYDISTYTESIADNNDFEETFKGQDAPVFPHDIPNLRSKNNNYSILKAIPAGNNFTTDFAKEAIINENLGKGKHTDFLAISYSSTDYVGHQFGVASKEIEDTYLRFDKDLADLLSFLDTQVGKDNYTLFLTADHAAVQVPSYLKSVRIPAHYFSSKKLLNHLKKVTKEHFNSDELIENISNYQVFLNHKKIAKLRLNTSEVVDKIVDASINYKGIYKVVSAKTLQSTTFENGILNSLQNGYNQKFSGDVLFVPYPSTLPSYYDSKGTSHGSGYSYDTHIPLIFYGNGITQGASKKKYEIVDVAPTICSFLQIEFPNGNTGKIIEEVFE